MYLENYHIILNHFYTKPYINFVVDNFDGSKHKFCVWGRWSKKEILINNSNIYYFGSYNPVTLMKVIIDLNKSKQIILHGLFGNFILILLFFQPWLLRKCAWLIWGGDLYYNRDNKSIKFKIGEFLKKIVIKRINVVVSGAKHQYEYAIKMYNSTAIFKEGMYLSPIDFNFLGKYINKSKNDNCIQILLGNSADEENRHLEAFNILEKFKHENIKIICPLSYGDKNNAQYVIEQGIKKFGNKFHPLTKILEKEEYAEQILKKVDIAIMNHRRHQALGNIKALLYLGKKVYARDGNLLNYFSYHGIVLYNVENIRTMNIEELKYHNKTTCLDNREAIVELLDEKLIAKLWRDIFY